MWEVIFFFNSLCGMDIYMFFFFLCVKIWWVIGMVCVIMLIIFYIDVRVLVIYFYKFVDFEIWLNYVYCCYICKRFVKLIWNIRWLVVFINIFNMVVGFKGESVECGIGFCCYYLCGLDFCIWFNNVVRWKLFIVFLLLGSLCRLLMLFLLLSIEYKMMFNGGFLNCF